MMIFMKIALVVLWLMMGAFLWQAVELFIATESLFNAWDEALRQQGDSQ